MKFSNEDKEIKRKRDNLIRICASIKSEFSFKKIRTYHDYLKRLGRNVNGTPDKPLTFPELKELLERLQDEFETELKREKETASRIQVSTEEFNKVSSEQQVSSNIGKADQSTGDSPIGYKLPESAKEKASLLWFQSKAAIELLDGINKYNKLAQFLVGGAGSGKTYVLGAVLRRLLDANWHRTGTISPWPIIYVTKASVVTQTKRVLKDDFGIEIGKEVSVIGIDQLRAKFGSMFVNIETQIIGGEEIETYTWRPMINPKLIVLDEAHSVKNHTSKQHKIMLSYASLPNVYQIFASATPYTRVSEGKVFVLAAKIEYDII